MSVPENHKEIIESFILDYPICEYRFLEREELIFSPKDREKVGAKVVAEANRLRSGAPAPEKADGTLKGALKEVGSAVAAAASQINPRIPRIYT